MKEAAADADELLRAENEYLQEMQLELAEQRDRYLGLFSGLPTACVALDDRGVIREVNRAGQILLGVRTGLLVDKPLRVLLVEQDRRLLVNHLRRVRVGEGGQPVITEVRLAGPDRAPPVAVELVSAARGPGGLWPTLVVNVEERLRVAEERRALVGEAAAGAEMAARDQFVAMISHELRTPLMPILAAVSALRARPGAITAEALASKLETIERNVVTEARLVDDLLDATRLQRGKLTIRPEVTSVHDAALEAAAMLEGEARHRELAIELHLDADRHHASADPLRLRQVFWNLLRNAIKFTPPRGKIAVRSWSHESVVSVEVSDTGRGLSATALERLFLPFEPAVEAGKGPATGGLGLGLAIAKGLIDLHGGRILAASPGPGKGCRFVVELPVLGRQRMAVEAAAAARQTAVPASTAPVPPATVRVLLVEDHADTAAMLTDLLELEGYQVQRAATAAAALQVDLAAVDIVVSDLGLPDLSGHELMRALRKGRPISGVALSGFGTEADRQASREAGFAEHLVKPVAWEELVATIRRLSADGR